MPSALSRSALVACVAALVIVGCGGDKKDAAAPGRCSGDKAPSLSESQLLPTGTAGGANAWFEAKVNRLEPVASANHVLLDGKEISIARTKTLQAELVSPSTAPPTTYDPSEGRVIVRASSTRTTQSAYPHVVSFRIPPGTAPGKHEVQYKTCDVAAPETMTIEVLASSAPTIDSIRVVNGEWPAIVIKGANLMSAEEVVLVSGDETVTRIENVTRIDDSQLRAPLDKLGTYEVFVRSKAGLGGGPPNGVVTAR